MKIKSFFNDYLNLNRSERKALYFIILLILIFGMINLTIPYVKMQQTSDAAKFLKEIKQFNHQVAQTEVEPTDEFNIYEEEFSSKKYSLFYFDPNAIGFNEWKKLGVSDYSARWLENYKKKGGKFRKPDDLKRFQGINDVWYNQIKDYITIESPIKDNKELKAEVQPILLDLNKAEKDDLMRIKGIGNTFSDRIIKYRNVLGGYYSVVQLSEVYGIDSIMYLNLKQYFEVKNPEIVKIPINLSDNKQLSAHPYIDFQQANGIINYRNKNGPYNTVDELLKTGVFNDTMLLNRLRPYLKLW